MRDGGAANVCCVRQTAGLGYQVGPVVALLPKDAVNSSHLCCHPFHPAISGEGFLSLRKEDKPFTPASPGRAHCGVRLKVETEPLKK